jgi:NAD-dependent SIR2 family protein deacetylase
MTIETKGTIELKDINSFEFECVKCHSKIVLTVRGFKKLPTQCPDCDEPWLINGSEEFFGITDLLRKVQRAVNVETNPPFTLRLGIRGLGESKDAIKPPSH